MDINTHGLKIQKPGTYTAGDTIGMALDADTRAIQIYKNNTLLGTMCSVTGTSAIRPCLTPCGTITANFGASALTYAPPSGYNAGLYV